MVEEITPSLRRPVSSSVRSVRSAIMERQEMSNSSRSMVSKNPATSMIQNRAALPFSGKKPSRRRPIGMTLIAMPLSKPVMATVFFSRPTPQRAIAGGRNSAATAIGMTMMEICSLVNSQK